MRVVFIDDGINYEFIKSKKKYVHIMNAYTVTNNKVVSDKMNNTNITHCSICAKIFIEEVNCRCDIFFIRILDDKTLRGSIYSLVVALEWCLLNNIDVINLSLGTTNIKEAGLLQESIEKLVKNEIIIVAAASNCGFLTYPAAFTNIIGVKALNSASMLFPFDCLIFEVPHKEYIYNKKAILSGQYNSFAAPVITAKVCDCINNGFKDIDGIKKIIWRNNIARRYQCLRYYNNTKPTILFDVDKYDNHIEDVLYILNFFENKGFYGVCITNLVPSVFSQGIINIQDVELDIEDIRIRLSYLTSYIDGDFFIWHMESDTVGKTNLKSVDLVICERVTEKKLNRILKEFTM